MSRFAESLPPHAQAGIGCPPQPDCGFCRMAPAGAGAYGPGMSSQTPLHVVIAGGGVAALEAMMGLRDLAEDRVELTLLAPEPEFELKPLRTAEPFARDHVRRYPLGEIAERFGARLRATGLAGVDPERYTATLTDGTELAYDALVLAVGARPRPAYPNVITFGADARTEVLNSLLADLEGHYTRSVAFVVPPGNAWPLPLYELALMTRQHIWGMGIDDVRLELVSPEVSPLAVFGPEPSHAIAMMLEDAGIVFHGQAYAEIERGRITMRPGDNEIVAERIVALPLLEGPVIPGVPLDRNGFIPIDDRGRVRGLTGVYAAGDAADFPVKQGGLACQQADAIAEYLAAQAGAPISPRPFRPVLRGKLLTGRGSHFMRHALAGGAGEPRDSDFSLWQPPTKISGRYLSQWLAHFETHAPADEGHMDIEIALPSPYALGRRALTLDPYSPLRH